jgi:hypothetical protein
MIRDAVIAHGLGVVANAQRVLLVGSCLRVNPNGDTI